MYTEKYRLGSSIYGINSLNWFKCNFSQLSHFSSISWENIFLTTERDTERGRVRETEIQREGERERQREKETERARERERESLPMGRGNKNKEVENREK
jgi:hypothetical protein